MALITLKVTHEEHAEHHALAQYLGVPLSELVRRLLAEERQRLITSGKRPPRK